ncbi:MAG: DUF4080 domain-containing protein [Deltaproteobacteria bacterium]|nr:DUF4080 domain-containing protein [Deltaproteobacteria bacterium]
MTDQISRVVLTAINAKYIHSSLSSRYLLANLGEFEPATEFLEFTILERAQDIAEQILVKQPDCIIFSCYIWNITLTEEVVCIIRAVRPQTLIVLGGPEVSYPEYAPAVNAKANHVICGEGEEALPNLLRSLNAGLPVAHTIFASPVALCDIALPYHLYSDADIAHRIIYVESSRGCAYGCEFCLSSLDEKVRHFDSARVIEALDRLWQRGVRQFKFIDRTIHFSKAKPILRFFLDRLCPELFLHFEIVPDRITDSLIELLQSFPDGAVQLEAGVQTMNPDVSCSIGRRQNMEKTVRNIRRIVEETGVHIHSDLVVGLPGETMESLAEGFNCLLDTGVHEIQVGILKRLRGAPIDRHTLESGMIYRETPPYDILQNAHISFMDMQRLKRFSRYFDIVVNNGNFKFTAPLIWKDRSPFYGFLAFSDWLFEQSERTAGIALDRLAEYLFDYLVTVQLMDSSHCANTLRDDYAANGRPRLPKCVREFASTPQNAYSESMKKQKASGIPERQRRHRQ